MTIFHKITFMDFFADCMLGRLARWLRLLGFDVAYRPAIEDEEIIRLTALENRILLTKDHKLAQRVRKFDSQGNQVLLIQGTRWDEQVPEVIGHFALQEHIKPFTRCLRCNQVLTGLPKEQVKGLVPSAILENKNTFLACQGCGRVYWEGSHFHRMNEKIKHLLDKILKDF